ncbi:MAG: c-type cytochrome [Planctomycetales bacterium]
MPATEQTWRDLKLMHLVFAISSLALFGATLWMMAKDHDREWRVYQKKFTKLDADQIAKKEKALETPAYDKSKDDLKKQVEAGREELRKHHAKVTKVQDELDTLQGQFSREDRNTKFQRAVAGVKRADYDIGVRDSLPKAKMAELKKAYDDSEAEVAKMEIKLLEVRNKLDAKKAELAGYTRDRDNAEAALKKLTSDVDRLDKAHQKLEPTDPLNAFKRWTMTLPIIDGFNSPLKIQQDWLPNLLINYGGMTDVARFDRCRTCHLGIERVEGGGVAGFPAKDLLHPDGYEQPFSTHPRTDLYLTASSPHPTVKFGCTICHEGQGSGTSFTDASHTPNDPAIGAHWEKDHHYHSNHFWEYPMLPERFRDASCIKCHHSVVELGVNPKFGNSAPKVYEGYETISKFGCFGCHEINGFDGGKSVGPDLRLEPTTPEEAAKLAEDPNAKPGQMRKVGPALTHIASKTTPGWTQTWTEEPAKFRPTTRMPQFFHLEGQMDDLDKRYAPVEIAAMSHYLFSKSEPLDMLQPAKDYKPNADRGKQLFSTRGCLNCHTHPDFPAAVSDFGPELSRVGEKLQAGPRGFNWLYTWIRDPERHHPRTKMPNLFLDSYKEANADVDPAADIAAWLLSKGPGKFDPIKPNQADLKELASMYLTKALNKIQSDEILKTGVYPEKNKDAIKGDEVELYTGDGSRIDENKLLSYVGRRSISRYGCYGCHQIPGFEKARPIGTALQNWGRKDSSKLAMEHIHEFLHHHGEPDGKSTKDRAEKAAQKAFYHDYKDPVEEERETSIAFYYDRVMHNDRAGFLWQKLRSPRSYDYKKIETKSYEERLRMPKFPFQPKQIEAVTTFVLGLVAEPPAPQYLYQPKGAPATRIQGERLLAKYNCTGCHMVDLPTVKYAVDTDTIAASELAPEDYDESLKMLLHIKPPRQAETGKTVKNAEGKELPVISFKGILFADADKEAAKEDQEYSYKLWETLKVKDKLVFPSSPMLVSAAALQEVIPARGGAFAEWLVGQLIETKVASNRDLAWQMAPPPLYLEGHKVQTSWLYSFLKNPTQIRYTTALRMPRFNMSDEEAQILANYFSAVDGSEYPYQSTPQREPQYLSAMEKSHPHYQQDAWKMLNSPLCVKCHALAGREYVSLDPKNDIRGPNLMNVSDRLRPEWAKLWILRPNWVTPYTSMPVNFEKGKVKVDLFGGDGLQQAIAVRDALFNYKTLMETFGKLSEKEIAAIAATAPGGAPPATPAKPAEKPPEAKKPPEEKKPVDEKPKADSKPSSKEKK